MYSLKQFHEASQQRNEAVYGWLRWLVLLAAACFAALLGLMGGKTMQPLQLVLLKAALLCQAGGILAGAIAIYGEVAVAQGLLEMIAADCIRNISENRASETNGINGTYIYPLSWFYRFAEKLCYCLLVLSLLCLAAWVWLM